MKTESNLETPYKDQKPGQRGIEAGLIVSTANGDEEAFESLYQRYYQRLFQFVFRMNGRLDCIDDIINDVMYVVWEKASTYNQTCRPSTWIFGIAYNKSRKYPRGSHLGADSAGDESLEDANSNGLSRGAGEDWSKQIETENWLEVAFESLSAEQRAVVELTYYHGMHYREIAEILQCPENTVKTRMFHARKILASALRHGARGSLDSKRR